jgi:hypothetical protein
LSGREVCQPQCASHGAGFLVAILARRWAPPRWDPSSVRSGRGLFVLFNTQNWKSYNRCERERSFASAKGKPFGCLVILARALRVARSHRALNFSRIGVHLGDVIVEGDDLYGDGLNWDGICTNELWGQDLYAAAKDGQITEVSTLPVASLRVLTSWPITFFAVCCQ